MPVIERLDFSDYYQLPSSNFQSTKIIMDQNYLSNTEPRCSNQIFKLSLLKFLFDLLEIQSHQVDLLEIQSHQVEVRSAEVSSTWQRCCLPSSGHINPVEVWSTSWRSGRTLWRSGRTQWRSGWTRRRY